MKFHAANKRVNDAEYRQGRLVLQSWPQVFDLGLTLKCNLQCIMCGSRYLPQIDFDPPCLERLAPYLRYGRRIVWNDSGEILSSSRTPQFLELMKASRPPQSSVSTNLLLVDRYIDDILDSGLTDLNVSVDAVTREMYESIRIGGRWDRLIANLELMQRRKAERRTDWPRLTFVFVAMRRNLDQMVDYVDFARRYGAIRIVITRLQPINEDFKARELPSLDEEKAVYRQALVRARAIGIDIVHTFFNNAVLLDEIALETQTDGEGCPPSSAAPAPPDPLPQSPLPTSCLPPLASLHRRRIAPGWGDVPICPSPWTEMFIQADGKVRACCFSPEVLGDLHDQTLPEIWNGPRYQSLRRRILARDYSACPGCHYLAGTLAAGTDPIIQRLGEIEEPIREQARWLEVYAADLDRLADGRRRLGRGRVSERLHGLVAMLQALARVLGKSLVAGPALARAFQQQRRINRHVIEIDLRTDEFARRPREDMDVLADVERLSAHRPPARCAHSTAGLDRDEAQDPMDALFYSARFVCHETPGRLRAGQRIDVPLSVRNAGAVAWPVEGDHAVKVAYSWYHDNGALCLLDGLRTPLARSPQPGEVIDLGAVLQAPDRPGRYILRWDLVYDPYAWFAYRGSPPLDVDVVVEGAHTKIGGSSKIMVNPNSITRILHPPTP